MDKDKIKEVIKEMFKNEEIKIYVATEGDALNQIFKTEVQVFIDGEGVQSHTDEAYLEDLFR